MMNRMEHEEFNRVLEFMLSMGIIDYVEYNLLIIKSTPYLK